MTARRRRDAGGARVSPGTRAALDAGVAAAQSSLRATLENREDGSLDPWELGELPRAQVAADSETIVAAMVAAVEASFPPGEVGLLGNQLRRDLRSGATGVGVACAVLSAEIVGMVDPAEFDMGTAPQFAALDPTHMTTQGVLAETVDLLLASGVRERAELMFTAGNDLAAASPQILATCDRRSLEQVSPRQM